jgi:hypothetical protein
MLRRQEREQQLFAQDGVSALDDARSATRAFESSSPERKNHVVTTRRLAPAEDEPPSRPHLQIPPDRHLDSDTPHPMSYLGAERRERNEAQTFR